MAKCHCAANELGRPRGSGAQLIENSCGMYLVVALRSPNGLGSGGLCRSDADTNCSGAYWVFGARCVPILSRPLLLTLEGSAICR